MAKEAEYRAQLEALGVWREPFAAAVHELCILEREQSRARKEWKNSTPKGETPSVLNPVYKQILTQGRDIAALRDSLGLTPNGLRKLTGANTAAAVSPSETLTALLDNYAGGGHD